MQDSYLPIFLLMAAAVAMAVGMAGLSALLGRSRRPAVPSKLSPYECGMPVQGSARQRFSIHFYIVAMLFIVFDLETAFLFPWAVVYRRMGFFGMYAMLAFIVVLLVGYAYVWRKGGFRWS